jgi:iron(III) transport system permease protein
LLAAAVVLPPLIWLAAAMVAALAAPAPQFLDRTAVHALGNSLLIASGATCISLALGLPYGWFTARYRLPGRRLLTLAALGPILLPPYAGSLAWSWVFIPDGWLNEVLFRWGWVRAPLSTHGSPVMAALVLGFAYWPVIAWFTMLAARSVPGPLEDAARLHLRDPAAARWSAWPALGRALPAAGLLVFLLALADFGVPNSLGVSTYPTDIVRRFQEDWQPGVVVRMAVPLAAMVVPLVWLQLRCLEHSPVGANTEGSAKDLDRFPWTWIGACWCLLVLGAAFLVPFGVLFAFSLPLDTYRAVWVESSDHFLHTLVTAGGGALLAVMTALAYGWATRGRRVPGLDLFLTLPYALPASLIGIAMIQLLNRPGPPAWLYSSVGGLVWTYAALFFPFAHKTLQPGWGHVDSSLLDEGELLGASAWARFRTAAWPVLRPYAAAAGAIVMLLAAREMDATALVKPPRVDTLAFRIHDYLHFDPGPNVGALCVLLVLLSAGMLGLIAAWAWRSEA